MPVIGFLSSISAADRPHHTEAFRQGLNETGYAAAGAMCRVLPLAHDAFQPHLAGVVEHGLAVVEFQMLVEPDADGGLSQDRGERGLATTSGSRRRSSPFSSIRSKA